MATRMQQRRGTASQWTIADPVLAAGEIGVESDTAKFKIGDGINTWSTLDYFETSGAFATEGYVDTAVAGILDAAPETLDTLNELAAALNDDPAFFTNISSTITSGDSATLASANSYTDGEITTLDTSLKAYADQAEADAISTANSYTDGEITTLDTSLKAYADQAEADAITSSNSYTDTAVAIKKTEISQAVSSDITAEEGYRYLVDTSATRTITLPASPSIGDEVQFLDATGTAGTNNITINNNSEKINGVSDTALLDVNGVAAVFIYTGSTYGWRMG